jgi:hypothetical protein
MVERSNADQGRNLLAVQLAQLRQLSHQCTRQDRPDTWCTPQELFLRRLVWIGADQMVEVAI